MTRNVVIGFLGSTLDAPLGDKRWGRWRPTVSLFGGDDSVHIDALELIYCHEKHVPILTQVKEDISTLSPYTAVNTHVLDIKDPWDFPQVYAALHEFAKQYSFEDDTNYYVHLTTGSHVMQISLFLLTEARYFPAKLIDTGPVKNVEPWKGRKRIIDLNLSTYDLLAKRFAIESLDSQDLLKGGVKTANPTFNKLIKQVETVALRSKEPILLTGPTGAGKSQLAGRIYALRSSRHQMKGPFVEVNCATLRGDNAMSTLFGHKKGAFTGAMTDRAGLLKSADGGTLFLDEIGELGLDEQAMLLRALEDKRFTPLGSDTETKSDFQLIAGTNKDLLEEVAKGRFRSDLLARINLWSFELPGLAHRIEDLEPNIEFELNRVSQELGRRVTMNKEASEMYLEFGKAFSWPGNFRDLASSITRMATLCDEGRIGSDDVSEELQRMRRLTKSPTREETKVGGDLVGKVLTPVQQSALDDFDRVQLEYVLKLVLQHKSLAAAGRAAFSSSRLMKDNPNDSDRLRKYLARWNLTYQQVKSLVAGGTVPDTPPLIE